MTHNVLAETIVVGIKSKAIEPNEPLEINVIERVKVARPTSPWLPRHLQNRASSNACTNQSRTPSR